MKMPTPTTDPGLFNYRFNLENTFVIMLKDKCDENDRLGLKLVSQSIMQLISCAIAIAVMIWCVVLDTRALSTGLLALILVFNAWAIISVRSALDSPAKRLLNDILYNPEYTTRKVNNESVMVQVGIANQLNGQLISTLGISKFIGIANFAFILIASIELAVYFLIR